MLRTFSLFLATSLSMGLVATAFADDSLVPRRYNPRSLDRSLTVLELPDASAVWSAWSYRNQGEFDLAVSVRQADGIWSEPEWIGFGDGIDQSHPALAADASGHLYLAWSEARLGRVLMSMRPRSAASWSTPIVLTDPDAHGTSPSLAIVGGQLVAAWREGADVEIRDLGPTLAASAGDVVTRTIQDGADPLGMTGEGADPEGDEFDIRDPSRYGDEDRKRPRPPRRDEDGFVDRRGGSQGGG